jgi:beta-lactamase regulating signal transducer with metallopeptidase domain
MTLPIVLVWGLKASPLLLAAWGATALLRRASAATRHFVWVLAIGGTLALPVIAALLPRWEVGVLQRVEGAATETTSDDQSRPAAPNVVDAPGPVEPLSEAVMPLVDFPHTPPSNVVARLSSPSTALLFWSAGAAGIGLLIAVSLIRTHRLARQAEPMGHAVVLAEAGRIARQLGIRRPVTILHAMDDAMPMTWGAFRPHVLLPAAFPEWSPARREAVLVHELAHVKRMDWLTQLIARVACALYWWNPLAWVAARRLREERELACDDLVLAQGTVASTYAGDLLEIARTFRPSPATALAGVAMARRSQLADRLLAVLDPSRVRGAVGSRQAATAVTAVAALVMPLAAVAAGYRQPAADAAGSTDGITAGLTAMAETLMDSAGSAAPYAVEMVAGGDGRAMVLQSRTLATLCDWSSRGTERSSNSTNINDDQMTIKIVRDECTLTVDSDGKITFTDDDRDVAGISRGGYFEIEERVGRERRRVEIAPAGNGLERRWLVNGDEQAFNDEARTWLADVILVLMRRSGLNAEARAIRILDQQGVDGLLREIDQLMSDYVASQYYQVLFDRAEVAPAQQARLLTDASHRIKSDYELGRVLKSLATRGPLERSVQLAYVKASDSLESDYEHRQALDALIKSGDLDTEAMDAMLRSAQRLDSDYERAQLLTTTAARYPAGRPLPASYVAAVADMESDYERRRVLSPLLARDELSSADRARVLEVLTRMSSDYERAEVLLGVVEDGAIDNVTRAPFFRAVDRMSSDHERQRVLSAVAERRPDEATTVAVLTSATDMSSDYSKAQVLVAVARRGLPSDQVREAYLSALDSMSSSYERDRARRAAGLR